MYCLLPGVYMLELLKSKPPSEYDSFLFSGLLKFNISTTFEHWDHVWQAQDPFKENFTMCGTLVILSDLCEVHLSFPFSQLFRLQPHWIFRREKHSMRWCPKVFWIYVSQDKDSGEITFSFSSQERCMNVQSPPEPAGDIPRPEQPHQQNLTSLNMLI